MTRLLICLLFPLSVCAQTTEGITDSDVSAWIAKREALRVEVESFESAVIRNGLLQMDRIREAANANADAAEANADAAIAMRAMLTEIRDKQLEQDGRLANIEALAVRLNALQARLDAQRAAAQTAAASAQTATTILGLRAAIRTFLLAVGI